MPESLQPSLIPQWWDLLTLFRLMTMGLFVLGWFGLGLAAGPWFFRKFDDLTRGYVQWMVHTFDRMFTTVQPRWCLLSIVLSIALGAALGLWLTSGLPTSFGYHFIRAAVIGILVVLGYGLPRRGVKYLWKRRINRFENQLLDALAFMSNGLRSGLSLIQCMEMVVEELPDPISQEFGLVISEQKVGVPFEEALLNLEKRIETEDVQILVTSINILRQSGGNLSETFQTIAYTVRERKKVQGKIRSLTAQGMAQAVIILIMPFALGLVLYTFDHELVARMWTTWLGWVLIGVMLILQTFGALIMRKVVMIKV